MHITLIYKSGGNGQVAFAADPRFRTPSRRYSIVDGMITLAGHVDDVLHADADELLRSDAYRMLTPMEQEQMAPSEQASNQVQESTEQSDTDQGMDELSASAEQPPPALDTSSGKKKASGG